MGFPRPVRGVGLAERGRAAAVVLTLQAAGLAASPATAQLPSPTAAALGMGGNYAAVANGFAAPAWNPALLGLSGRPSYSVAVLTGHADLGMDPVSGLDLLTNANEAVSSAKRSEWLQEIESAGGQSGVGAADVTYLAFSTGAFALQVSTQLQGAVRATPDLARLALDPGSVADRSQLDVTGSRIDFFATSTVGASYATRVSAGRASLGRTELTLGGTLKYTLGHYLLTGRHEFGYDDPFPIIRNDTSLDGPRSGGGVGLDVGAALRSGPWTASLAVQNVIAGFSWDVQKLELASVDQLFSDGQAPGGSVDDVPELLKRVGDLRFEPVVSAGVAVRPSPRLLVSADARTGSRKGMDPTGVAHVGVGVEYMALTQLPIRGGVALLDGGYQIAGGVGLRLGGMDAAVAAGARDIGFGAAPQLMASFSYTGR